MISSVTNFSGELIVVDNLPNIYEQRCLTLQNSLKQHQLDYILLCSRSRECRATLALLGVPCTSSLQYLLITQDSLYIFELQYRIQALMESNPRVNFEVIPVGDEDLFPLALKRKIAANSRIGIIGDVPFSAIASTSCLNSTIDLSSEFNHLTVIKSPQEQAQIAALQNELSSAIDSTLAAAKPGMTEIELCAILKGHLAIIGDTPAFPITVISGDRLKNSTVGRATTRTLLADDGILIDAGVVRGGFYSDCTRMHFFSDSPQSIAYQDLRSALAATSSSLKAHISSSECNFSDNLITVNEIFSRLKDHCLHFRLPFETLTKEDLGHGIGFSLHEDPYIFREETADFSLRKGSCFTLEPELTIEGSMIRIEDLITI